ncbi:hypothetical protein RXV94_03460 [Yeosuana sp. MJ-SS3]|uniref:DUF2971 domain-containing protein n=1 Tax=Gilvirhabdus luticola TaxID=3079858 RepID=A0ABU3U487_9FLAO|nr:hypothetical protein [Yeosuana sp. MJ-SS3]MDU8885203.1 hypothetical protein [Yeosuana sp. MJ-SS3]
MNFWKFLNLLETSSLYFSNAENLGDNNEGRIPEVVYQMMIEQDNENGNTNNQDTYEYIENNLRKETLISSWTYHDDESYALWKMYAKDKMGIAIKTDIPSLRESFNETDRLIYIGEVKYFDPKSFHYSTTNLYYPFLVKLKYYSFENELRCITSCTQDELKENKLVKVDLNKLIKEVYISPNSKPEFKKLIELLSQTYNVNFKVNFSKVNDKWL